MEGWGDADSADALGEVCVFFLGLELVLSTSIVGAMIGDVTIDESFDLSWFGITKGKLKPLRRNDCRE